METRLYDCPVATCRAATPVHSGQVSHSSSPTILELCWSVLLKQRAHELFHGNCCPCLWWWNEMLLLMQTRSSFWGTYGVLWQATRWKGSTGEGTFLSIRGIQMPFEVLSLGFTLVFMIVWPKSTPKSSLIMMGLGDLLHCKRAWHECEWIGWTLRGGYQKLFQMRSQFAALEGRTPRPSNFAGAHHNRVFLTLILKSILKLAIPSMFMLYHSQPVLRTVI